MSGPWHHPPGTLRALLATFGQRYVICQPCRRYTPMRVATKDLDRKFDPCPFRCSMCHQRGKIVSEVPDGFVTASSDLEPSARRPTF